MYISNKPGESNHLEIRALGQLPINSALGKEIKCISLTCLVILALKTHFVWFSQNLWVPLGCHASMASTEEQIFIGTADILYALN